MLNPIFPELKLVKTLTGSSLSKVDPAVTNTGKYVVKLDRYTAVIDIKYVPNPCGLREIMKMGVEDGTFKLDFDIYGVANMSFVTIMLRYKRNEYNYTDKIVGHHVQSYSIKKDCILYINSLIDVVRFKTGRHWIPFISEKMMASYST